MMDVRSIIDTYKGHDRHYGHDRHFGCHPRGGYDGHGCQAIHGRDSYVTLLQGLALTIRKMRSKDKVSCDLCLTFDASMQAIFSGLYCT